MLSLNVLVQASWAKDRGILLSVAKTDNAIINKSSQMGDTCVQPSCLYQPLRISEVIRPPLPETLRLNVTAS